MYKISEALIPDKMSDEQRQEASQSIKSSRPVDNTISYVLALLPGEKFPLYDSETHNSFYELKKEYPNFFSDLIFERDGIHYSEGLNQILFGFGQSGILEWSLSPPFYYFTEKKKKVVLESLSDKFSDEEKEELSEMSKKLQELLFK